MASPTSSTSRVGVGSISSGEVMIETASAAILFMATSFFWTWFRTHQRETTLSSTSLPHNGGNSKNNGTSPLSYPKSLSKDEVSTMRTEHISPSVTVAYANSGGLMITRGMGSRLYDEMGRCYLDTRNNVCHVGHCHPAVAAAVSEQVSTLNTNTRYLHPNIGLLARRLVALCPPPLEVVVFVNSGSEANDLALRLARAYTGSKNTIVFDGAYHGHTLSVLEISPYKYEMGTEYPPTNILQPTPTTAPTTPSSSSTVRKYSTPGSHIWQCPRPDTYRGPHRGHTAQSGAAYAQYVREGCDYYTNGTGEKVGAMIMEGGLSIGGCILPPPGFIQQSVQAVRDAGGVYIADEVQTGFGRCGVDYYWAFQYASNNDPNFSPDILTVGKPLGNGMPLAAVITTREIATTFYDLGVDYFNTFGGNPVCAAAGLAVLDVLERENLQKNATDVGNYLAASFRRLQELEVEQTELEGQPTVTNTSAGEEKKQDEKLDLMSGEENAATDGSCYIGDVRGCGLFMGVELVRNKTTLEPATKETSYICTLLKQKYSILTTIDGEYENVIIIKPPLVFSREDADYFVQSFAKAMKELKGAGSNAIESMSKTPT